MSKSLIQLPNGQHVYVAWSEEATRIMYDPAASAQAVLEAYGSGKVYAVVEQESAGSKIGSTIAPLAAHLPLRMETPIPPELDGLLRRGAMLKITPPEHTYDVYVAGAGCPVCGAKPGEPCINLDGTFADPPDRHKPDISELKEAKIVDGNLILPYPTIPNDPTGMAD